MNLNLKTRLFLILFSMGMAGVLSILLIDLSALLSLIPFPADAAIPTITLPFKVLSLIQPTLILAGAVFIGVRLARKVGLSAPVAEALSAGGNTSSVLKPQVIPGIAGGLMGGLCIVLVSLLFRPFMMSETLDRIAKFGKLLPLPTRLLSGGITEELLLRWGFMTLVVWLAWRLLQKGRTNPTKICFVGAILLSSLVFGLGHLPVAFMLLPEASLAVVLFVIIANSAFGLVAGYLYWKKGLESAMIAHVFCHVVLAIASAAGAYF